MPPEFPLRSRERERLAEIAALCDAVVMITPDQGLSCDLKAGDEHGGPRHHDPAFGVWWQLCPAAEHGHEVRAA